MKTPDLFADVIAFHDKFDVKPLLIPGLPDNNTMTFRLGFIQEEFDELKKACLDNNLEEVLDALVDLVWICLGTAHICNLPFYKGWDEVVRANMSKVKATSAEQSKRKFSGDIVKPEGWRGPDHKPALFEHENHCRKDLEPIEQATTNRLLGKSDTFVAGF